MNTILMYYYNHRCPVMPSDIDSNVMSLKICFPFEYCTDNFIIAISEIQGYKYKYSIQWLLYSITL